jgi:nucleoside-diphosphate-sugar epimerase
MAQKVLITGGAGYLGSIMTGELLRAGYEVTVLDNLMYGQHTLFSYCADPHFEFVRGDATYAAPSQKFARYVATDASPIAASRSLDRSPDLTASALLALDALANR